MSTNVTLPYLVIFGLDYVLWPFWVDTQLRLPFTRNSENGEITDSRGRVLFFYDDVPMILEQLKKFKIKIGVVTNSADIQACRDLFKMFDWMKFIKYEDISLPSLNKQFEHIHEKSGVAYADMLYFDDGEESKRIASRLGIQTKLIKDGITIASFNDGLREFERKST